MALMRLMGPAEGVSVTCPRCWQPIAGIHMPRWSWLVRFARYQPATCPCHHVLSGPNLRNLTEQAEGQQKKCPVCKGPAGSYRYGACSIRCDQVMGA